ncbi:MAG: ABC transporter permease [Candidatus Latescibacteria bacterium]|nr:ABC transporter permease [Candidatus Latescibacterota bacterium]
MLIFKLGYRNLWRNRRRTMLTMSAIGVSTALVVLMFGIYDGMLWDMIETATDLYHGHVKITARGYLDERKMNLTMEEYGYSEQIRNDPGIKGIAGRIRGFALLSTGEEGSNQTQPAELFGIDPVEERTVTRLDSHVLEGSFISGPESKDILLGKGLAKRLEANVGDEIVAMGQGSDGSIAADIFYVSGIVETADPFRDTSLAIVGRKTLQNMLVLEGGIHEWAISLKKPIKAQEWAQAWQSQLSDVDVTPWNQFLPQMGQLVDIWDIFEYIFALIFYFAVILVAANTMYMAFFERMREFGIMGAVGMKLRKLSLMIVLEGLLMSGLAGIIGGAAGVLFSLYIYAHPVDLSAFFEPITYGDTAFQPRLRCYIEISNMVFPVVMITVLGVLVAIFPAMKLRRLRPVEVLREV